MNHRSTQPFKRGHVLWRFPAVHLHLDHSGTGSLQGLDDIGQRLSMLLDGYQPTLQIHFQKPLEYLGR